MIGLGRGFEPFRQLREEVDRQLPALWSGLSAVGPRREGRAYPALNVWEEGDNYYAEAEVPGLQSENLEISVVGSELTIKGERGDKPLEGVSYHRRERGVGAFTRLVRLPVEIDGGRVSASLQDGVLLVTLPKSEAAKPRKIRVSPASAS